MSRQGVAQKANTDAAMTPDDLRAWRQAMGLSQRAAATALGVSSRIVERSIHIRGLDHPAPRLQKLFPMFLSLIIVRIASKQCSRDQMILAGPAKGRLFAPLYSL